jgi:uncharacterized phiE125 gp8 family phage protein
MQHYNFIRDIQFTSESSPGLVEPVTLAEVKNYMRLEGFTDELASTSDVSFETDDDLLEILITASRERLEKYTNLSFVPKEFRVVLTNGAGYQELPYGPIGDVTGIYEESDDDYSTNIVADAVFVGNEFKQLKTPNYCNMTIDYSAGYGRGDTPPLPKALKLAIMADVLYHYEHRGDEMEDEGLAKTARILASPFKRVPCL